MKRDDLCHPVREQLKRLPAPHAAHYGVVPLAPPEMGIPLGNVMHRHQQATQALARVNALTAELQDPYFISRILARREAVSSSSIEGTNSTLDELLGIEESVGEAHPNQEAALQVRDYALALDRLLPVARAQGPAIFQPDLIADLHRSAMQNDHAYRDVPGELRTCVVWIGGIRNIATSTYNPAPPEDVPACLADTLAYMRQEGMQAMTQGLIERIAIAHAHFEAVHPFRDGNGRVGRLLLPLMMAAEGQVPLYLSPYIEVHKDAYNGALKAAQQQLDWSAMIRFVADAILGTVDELMVTRTALAALQQDWISRRKFRARSAAARTIAMLTDYPVLTAKRLGDRLAVSIPSALTAIEQLEAVGILVERTGYKRNRVYAAQEALQIINRPFGLAPGEDAGDF